MNKKAILDFILLKYEHEESIDKEIIKEIRATITEIEIARAMFNSVNDPNLIEAAIYREEAAKKKFDYLFCKAKESYLKKNIDI